jgi:hypothetical protein
MSKLPGKRITKTEIIAVTAVLLVTGVILFFQQGIIASPVTEEPAVPEDESGVPAIVAEITSPFAVYTIPLDVDGSFHVDFMPNVLFQVSDGQIAFVKSDCPDQVCVNTGFLYRRGHIAACLPNRMLLMIVESEDDYNLDIFVR